jgi:hypothetical protein
MQSNELRAGVWKLIKVTLNADGNDDACKQFGAQLSVSMMKVL